MIFKCSISGGTNSTTVLFDIQGEQMCMPPIINQVDIGSDFSHTFSPVLPHKLLHDNKKYNIKSLKVLRCSVLWASVWVKPCPLLLLYQWQAFTLISD